MKIKNILLGLCLSSMLTANIYADSAVKVEFDGKTLEFPDAQPKIVDSRTMVPLRSIFEKLGFGISWDANTRSALLSGNGVRVQVSESDIIAFSKASGLEIPVDTSVLPRIMDDRFYLPLRAIAQTTGAQVGWDADAKLVSIKSPALLDKEAKEKEKELIESGKIKGDTSVSVKSEETDELKYYDSTDPTGLLKPSDEKYLKSVFDKLGLIHSWAIEHDDHALMRFYGMAYTDGEISPNISDHSELMTLCAEIEALKPGNETSAIHTHVLNFTLKVRSLCTSCDSGTLTAPQFTEKIDTLAKERKTISIDFARALNDYFIQNGVLYESVFGEYVLDSMN